MLEKKNPQKNLERKRWTYLLIGLVFSLGFSLAAINWESTPRISTFDTELIFEDPDDMVIPLTKPKAKPLPPPPPPPIKFEVVESKIELPGMDFDLDVTLDEDEGDLPIDESLDDDFDEVVPFVSVMNKPVFPGCESAPKEELVACFHAQLLREISKDFEYPVMPKEMNIEERIFVRFEINKKGKVVHAKVVKGNDPDLKKEALRLVRSIPDMQPATQRGKPVSVSFTIPISFSLK